VVGRIIDVHCTEPDWLFAILVKRVDRSGEAERRDAGLLGMPCTSPEVRMFTDLFRLVADYGLAWRCPRR
jgi:hypothetical protein